MGYLSYMTGELTISPPLRWSQFKTNEFFKDPANSAWRDGYPCIQLLVVRENVETDDGKKEVITAVAVESSLGGDVGKLYALQEEVQRLVDAFPGHEFTGEFLVAGTDLGDIWKLVVDKHRKVQKIYARIVWPDGTELRTRNNT